MATLSIAGWQRYMSEAGHAFWPAVERGLRSGGLRGLSILQRRTREAIPASENGSEGAFNTGDYLRRWKVDGVLNGVRFTNDHPAALVIEHGRRPGAKRPPSAALIPWIRRKLRLGPAEAAGAAFVIARAIGARGLRPRLILQGGEAEIAKAIEAEVEHELKAVIGEGEEH